MQYFTKSYFLFISFFFLYSVVQAQDYSEIIQNSGKSTDYPGSHVLTIFDRTKVEVEESGLGHFHMHQFYKILDEKGALNMRVMKFPYEPMSAFLKIYEVNIYRIDGTIESVPLSQVYDYPAPANLILWGAREQMVEIGWLDIGEAVEIKIYKKGYTYALLQDEDESIYIPPMRGHYYDIVPFWSDQHVLEKSYRIWIPKSKKLNYKVYHGELEIELAVGGEKQGFSFTLKNIKPMKREPNMVSPSDVFTKLLMTTAPDWQSKSKWFYGVNEEYGSFASTPEIDKKVSEILMGAKDELDSISRLNHWVADNIRYFGLTMGCGEGYTLHKGEMTFADRCGVCKDKAGMLVTMLRAAGFESYAAMTMAGSRIEDIPADQFNHSVTAVRLKNGHLMMLDPTWIPFVRENWSSREQQQNYIIGTKEGENLEIIPISAAENHYYKIKGTSELRTDGSLEGEFNLIAEGQSDAAFRSQLTRNPYSEWNRIIRGEILKEFPEMDIKKCTFSDGYDYSKPFEIYVSYTIPEHSATFGNELIFSPVVTAKLFQRMNYQFRIKTNINERKYPFIDACSKYIELFEEIKFPEEFELNSPSVTTEKTGKNANFMGAFSFKENTLIITEEIELAKRIYDVTDWDSFRTVLIAQNEFAKRKISLRPKSKK